MTHSSFDSEYVDDIALYAKFRIIGSQDAPGKIPQELQLVYQGGDKPLVFSQEDASVSKQDITLAEIYHFLSTTKVPEHLNLQQRQRFISKALKYFIQSVWTPGIVTAYSPVWFVLFVIGRKIVAPCWVRPKEW